MQNLSIPTIPSRFLTPVLRFDLQEKEESQPLASKDIMNRLNSNSGMNSGSIQAALAETHGSKVNVEVSPNQAVESVLVARVARLTNDGSTIGPGSYNLDKSSRAIQQSPRGGIKWAHQKSKKINDNFTKGSTGNTVGPGAYENRRRPDRSIPNPTIPRASYNTRPSVNFLKKQKIRNNGSIRGDFDELSDDGDYPKKTSPYIDKETVPGPGKYLTDTNTSFIGKVPIRHRHPGDFGVTAGRFKAE